MWRRDRDLNSTEKQKYDYFTIGYLDLKKINLVICLVQIKARFIA